MVRRDQLLKKSLKSGLTMDRQNFTSKRNKVIVPLYGKGKIFFMTVIERAKGMSKSI